MLIVFLEAKLKHWHGISGIAQLNQLYLEFQIHNTCSFLQA